MIGLHKDKVELLAHNNNWKIEYEKEKDILKSILKSYVLDIQHVGSTAIPNLSAKPILDIAVAVRDKKILRKLGPIMTQNGYDVLDNIEKCGELLARKGLPEKRTHYVHIEVLNSEYWNNHILFRNFLLKNPEHIKKYEDLKTKISMQHKNDRKKYTSEKNEFIQNILSLAKKEFKKD